MQIQREVLEVLSSSVVEGQILILPPTQLERKLYVKVNEVLTALGGRWTPKLKGHLFASDPQEAIENAILTGSYDKLTHNGFFETPPEIVQQMIEKAGVQRVHRVLEPSAGRGAIAERLPAASVLCIENRSDNVRVLREKGFETLEEDFLRVVAIGYRLFDRVVMNPPFEQRADVDHVLHAYGFLNSTGILVSIMSTGILFCKREKSVTLRHLIEAKGDIEELPTGAFRASGTNVQTVMVTLHR